LLRLDACRMRYVLSYCASQAAGLFTNIRGSEHAEKSCAASWMHAHNGVVAAEMVAHGLSGIEETFSGDPNYLSIFSAHPGREALVRGLGLEFEIMNGAVKRWSVGSPAPTDPLRRRRCVIEVTLKDGRTLSHHAMAAKGTGQNPVTRAELEEKATALMAPTMGKARPRALIDALWRIDSVASVRALRKLHVR